MNTPLNTSGPSTTYYPPPTTSSNVYRRYGVVQSVEVVRKDNSGIGAGTIVGAVVGGIVGNQVGKGRGNTAATVIGAAGGAYAGHEIEKRNQQASDAYKLTIRMMDGTNVSLMQTENDDIQVGDRVVVITVSRGVIDIRLRSPARMPATCQQPSVRKCRRCLPTLPRGHVRPFSQEYFDAAIARTAGLSTVV